MTETSKKRRDDAAMSKAAEIRVAVWFMEAGFNLIVG
jgi:hypothetical protein